MPSGGGADSAGQGGAGHQVTALKAGDIGRQRMRMQRDFRMGMFAEQPMMPMCRTIRDSLIPFVMAACGRPETVANP